MAATEVVLRVPDTPNLKDLADSTALAFGILQPWCKADFKSSTLTAIQRQARSYVKAIDFSITAAQHGYNITQEALAFAKLIDAGEEKDRQQYLHGMLDIAHHGEKYAQLAKGRFRDVRAMVGKLIAEARSDSPNDHEHTTSATDNLHHLESGLTALEAFSNCISSYISWWTIIGMCQGSQTTRVGQVVVNYNSLRHRDVVQKWRELGQEYVEYSDKIQAIQDSYPDFARELSKARSEETLSTPATNREPEVIGTPKRDISDQLATVSSTQCNPIALVFLPGSLFAARFQEQLKHTRKRDRIRNFGHKALSFIGVRDD